MQALYGILLLVAVLWLVGCGGPDPVEEDPATTVTTVNTAEQPATIAISLLDQQTAQLVEYAVPASTSVQVAFKISPLPAENTLLPVEITRYIANEVVQETRQVLISSQTGEATFTLLPQQKTAEELVEISTQLEGVAYTKTFLFQPTEQAVLQYSLALQFKDVRGVIRTAFSVQEPVLLLAVVKDQNGNAVSGLPVEFSSTVGVLEAETATTDTTGTAQVTLTPPVLADNINATAGTVTVTVSGVTQTAELSFYKTKAGQLTFEQASPTTIAVKGAFSSINYPETATLSFLVKDFNGAPLQGQVVHFALKTVLGGAALSKSAAVSDVDGRVTVEVHAGVVPGPLFVEAWIEDAQGNPIYKVSTSEVTVTTGVPIQDRFSISANTLNPEAWDYDKEPVEITVSLADMNGNPAKAGTVVNFSTEMGGSIVGSCQLDETGQCTVQWRSESVLQRPQDHRVTILAWAVGSERFFDKNGDWLYSVADDGEPYSDRIDHGLPQIFYAPSAALGERGRRQVALVLGADDLFVDENLNGVFDEPYDDVNGNGQCDPGENFVDYNGNSRCDNQAQPAGETQFIDLNHDGKYNGDGVAWRDLFTDLNLNGQFDVNEPFWDMFGLLKGVAGRFDGPWLNADAAGNYDAAAPQVYREDNGFGYIDVAIGTQVTAPVSRGDDFTDLNGNGWFDGAGVQDLSEPWRDDNENGVRDEGEPFMDFNANGLLDLRDGKYTGLQCHPDETECSQSLTYIRRAIVLVMASSEAQVVAEVTGLSGAAAGNTCNTTDANIVASSHPSVPANCIVALNSGGVISLLVQVGDTADQIMPTGTQISITTTGPLVGEALAFTVPSSNAEGGTRLPFSATAIDNPDGNPASISIQVSTPKGHISTLTIPVTVQ